MPRYEYKVVPAPKKASKVKGVKGTDQRFATALAGIMNEYGAEGWEYQRTDTLPCEERQGLTGRVTTFQNMLVFRREVAAAATAAPGAAPVEAETMLAVPSFRSTAPAEAAAIAAAAPEGRTPKLGAAAHPEPNDAARVRDIAAQ